MGGSSGTSRLSPTQGAPQPRRCQLRPPLLLGRHERLPPLSLSRAAVRDPVPLSRPHNRGGTVPLTFLPASATSGPLGHTWGPAAPGEHKSLCPQVPGSPEPGAPRHLGPRPRPHHGTRTCPAVTDPMVPPASSTANIQASASPSQRGARPRRGGDLNATARARLSHPALSKCRCRRSPGPPPHPDSCLRRPSLAGSTPDRAGPPGATEHSTATSRTQDASLTPQTDEGGLWPWLCPSSKATAFHPTVPSRTLPPAPQGTPWQWFLF